MYKMMSGEANSNNRKPFVDKKWQTLKKASTNLLLINILRLKSAPMQEIVSLKFINQLP
jgi:hypothetical protein